MSIDAITYAKTLDVDNPMSRLLLFIIAENTFNDSGLCKVGQAVLAYETRASERTVRTHIARLKVGKVIDTKARPKADGGRAFDAIELLGFLKWLAAARKKPEPAKSSGSTIPAKNAGSPVRTGRQVAGSNKEQSVQEETVLDPSMPPEGAETIAQSFERFYAAYPKHVAKTEAWHTFHLIVTGKKASSDRKRREPEAVQRATPAEVLAGARRFAATVKGKDQKYIPHPANWLSSGRWTDGIAPKAAEHVSHGSITIYEDRHPENWAAWVDHVHRTGDFDGVTFLRNQGMAMVPSPMPPAALEHA